MNVNQQAFLLSVKAGLWETEARLAQYEKIDFQEVYRLAAEQSVIGLITAGLEHMTDVTVPQGVALAFVGATLQHEQRNKDMNAFLARFIDKLQVAHIYTLLVKGQGIAQCYERPLWREAGDIDLLVDADMYESAQFFLNTIGTRSLIDESVYRKHIDFAVGSFVIELHGTLRGRLSRKIDNCIDRVQYSCFREGNVRIWNNDGTEIALPAPNEDIIFVFSHILQHFFGEGIGLRQLCDLCRLIWSYKETINTAALEKSLREMHVLSEWKVISALAVNYLGMPSEVMPIYDNNRKWVRRASRFCDYLLQTGNFGVSRTKIANSRQPYIVRKLLAFVEHCVGLIKRLRIFPYDSFFIFIRGTIYRIRAAFKGRDII